MTKKRTATKKPAKAKSTKRAKRPALRRRVDVTDAAAVDEAPNLVAVPSDFRIFREWFEARACGTPGCEHAEERIELRSACHPDAQTNARYNFTMGALSISCGACGLGIAEVAVSSKEHAKPMTAQAVTTPTTPQKMTAAAKRNRSRRR